MAPCLCVILIPPLWWARIRLVDDGMAWLVERETVMTLVMYTFHFGKTLVVFHLFRCDYNST